MKVFLRLLFFYCVSFTLFSCGNNRPEKTEAERADSVAKWTQCLTDSINKANTKYIAIIDDEFVQLIPYKIGFDLFKKRNLSFDKPFNIDSVFKKLFPGHFYKRPSPYEDGDTILLEAWSCPSCTKKQFAGWYDEVELLESFPLNDSNETRFKDTLKFIDDRGNNNILMSFSTTEFTTDLIPCGRFQCAFLGLALFTEENDKWNLKAFSPALGCYGSFQTAPAINLLKFGKNNFGCYINNSNGGAGGPYYSDSYIFGIVNSQFKIILSRIGTGRTNTGESEWKSKFIVTNEERVFSEVQILMQGDFSSNAHFIGASDDTSNTPIAIKELIKTKENFDYKIVSHYSFENGMYVLKEEDLTTSPSKKKE